MRENWKTIALALDKVVISVRSAFNIKTINILALIWISGRPGGRFYLAQLSFKRSCFERGVGDEGDHNGN